MFTSFAHVRSYFSIRSTPRGRYQAVPAFCAALRRQSPSREVRAPHIESYHEAELLSISPLSYKKQEIQDGSELSGLRMAVQRRPQAGQQVPEGAEMRAPGPRLPEPEGAGGPLRRHHAAEEEGGGRRQRQGEEGQEGENIFGRLL